MGVELSSLISAEDVEGGQVSETSDLDVEGSLDKVDTGDRSVRNKSGVVSLLTAPGDFLSLSVF